VGEQFTDLREGSLAGGGFDLALHHKSGELEEELEGGTGATEDAWGIFHDQQVAPGQA
jgi:hypothetical protein